MLIVVNVSVDKTLCLKKRANFGKLQFRFDKHQLILIVWKFGVNIVIVHFENWYAYKKKDEKYERYER